jgi:rod shape-determining protein MreC
MKQYLNFDSKKPNLSLQHSFNLVFRKIEFLFFVLLCMALLFASKVKDDFTKNISFTFVSISMPIINVVSFPFNSSITLLTNFSELVQAKEENENLKEELEKLKSYHVKTLDIYQENKELRGALNFINAKSSSYKVAQVIAGSNQVFNRQIIIDAGSNRDIKEGSIVIGGKAVIARVFEVGENKSRLLLVNDSASRIPVIASKSRVRAILAGNNSDLMEMLYLPKDHKIEIGEMIFTSGDGDTLLSGLLVGVVKEVNENSVLVSMVEQISNANIVTVIQY